MSKRVKAMELEALRASFGGVRDYVLLEPSRVDADIDYNVRKKLREKKISLMMVKNSLAKKAFGEEGITLKDEVWQGTTLVAWSPDGALNHKDLSKAVEDLLKEIHKDVKKAEDEKYQVKTAVADGQGLSLEDAKKMPTRQDAIADLLGALIGPAMELSAAIAGPGTELATALQTPGAQLASQIAQVGQE